MPPDPPTQYIRTLYAQEDGAQQAAKAAAEATGLPIHISPERGKLLQLTARMLQARNILEIGSFTGYSALWLAQALPKDGMLHTIEKNPAHAAIAAESIARAAYGRRIHIHTGDALDILPGLAAKGPFDFVFIDADKRQYPDYLHWAERYLRRGGVLAVDNTLLSGSVYSKTLPGRIRATTRDIMRRFNRQLAENPDFSSLLLPMDDGLTLALKTA